MVKSRTHTRIIYCDNICHTAVLGLLVEGWHNMIKGGIAGHTPMIGWNDKALVAYVAGDPAGVLSWNHIAEYREIGILIGYVKPKYRRMGIYTRLWRVLIKRAGDVGARNIKSSTAMANKPLRAHAMKMGRMESGVVLNYRLRDAYP